MREGAYVGEVTEHYDRLHVVDAVRGEDQPLLGAGAPHPPGRPRER